jgi:hypothetical protein
VFSWKKKILALSLTGAVSLKEIGTKTNWLVVNRQLLSNSDSDLWITVAEAREQASKACEDLMCD